MDSKNNRTALGDFRGASLQEKKEEAIERLTAKERTAYSDYIDSGKPSLAPSVQKELFELFLKGSTCEEIVRLNPKWPLGIVIKARIDGQWDLMKDDYVNGLLLGVKERVIQTQAESINFAADLLTAAHKYHGDRIKKYLQTGNEKELGSENHMVVNSIRSYREIVELLLKLTGQDKQQKVTGEVQHIHTTEAPENPSGLNPEQAAEILKNLEKKE